MLGKFTFKQKHEQQFTKREIPPPVSEKSFVLTRFKCTTEALKKKKGNEIKFHFRKYWRKLYIYIQNVTQDIEGRWSVRGGVTSSATSRHLESVVINVFQTQTQFLREQLSLAAARPPIISETPTSSRVEPKAELKQRTNMRRSRVGKEPGENESMLTLLKKWKRPQMKLKLKHLFFFFCSPKQQQK